MYKFGVNCRLQPRPRSANRMKDEPIGKMPYQASRRPLERDKFQLKRPSTLRKKLLPENLPQNKAGRAIITVPIDTQNPHSKHLGVVHCSDKYGTRPNLPDQETIQNLELESTKPDPSHLSGDSESPDRLSDATLLENTWKQYTTQFEQMKNDLIERQKAVVKLYVNLQNTHHKMVLMGQKVILPSSEDLSIMNVAKLSPEQLLRLCAVPSGQALGNTSLVVDVKRLYGLPMKIIATCEQTLVKRKEIIDWFATLKSNEKGIPMYTLVKKINEFTAENDMLRCSFEQAKLEFLRELNDMIDVIRKTVNEAVALQLRTEEQNYELSELSSQNSDLRKRIHHTENMRPNKGKMEELEKELKEERSRRNTLKERLTRAEGQMKIGVERASQLEAALEQARAKSWSLERTVQQLNKQNLKLQSDFDRELNILTTSIRENTAHLEEIGYARQKLQSEKEDLEKRLAQLSQSYNESLDAIKAQMDINLTKLMETEKKYQRAEEEKQELIVKMESASIQGHEIEKQNAELQKQIQEYEEKARINEKVLKQTKTNLDSALNDIEEYKKRVIKQCEAITTLEGNLVNSLKIEEQLKLGVKNKDEYIVELERKRSEQAKQLQESEDKMNSYEQQLSCLKSHITELKQDFGEFENLDELHGIVNEQRAKLCEATKHNMELAQALQQAHDKDYELQEQLANMAVLEDLVHKKDDELKMMSEKEEEQTNIIKLLRNNLEMRTQADEDLSRQITERKSEVVSLVANLEARKQQISQLEKIILALEEGTRNSSLQRMKDQEKIELLEKQLNEYETMLAEHKREIPASNLDSIINILEEELGTTFDPHLNNRSHKYLPIKKKHMGDHQFFETHTGDNNNQPIYKHDHEAVSAKIVMGKFVKKSFVSSNEQFKGDLGRKQAITNIKPEKPVSPCNIKYVTPVKDKENYREPIFADLRQNNENTLLSYNKFRNIPLLNSAHLRDEKKSKMFKLAGHRL